MSGLQAAALLLCFGVCRGWVTEGQLKKRVRVSICNARHLLPKTQILANLQITFSVFAARNTTGSDHLYNTFELLMMGIVLPETC